MLFCSRQFLVFFCAVFAIYWVLPWHKARVHLLLIASFFFYASWNKWLAILIFATTFMDYLVALGMDGSKSPARRRWLLGLSMTVNLGILVYFKYANFFLDSLVDGLEAAGVRVSVPVLEVILPIGISFYTFEAINYTVDVYRGKIRAETNLGHFMLFITFFPHLVAGPIVRARDFLPQIRRPKRWDWARLQLGGQLFLLGLFKKLAIADRMAQFVDPVFQDPGHYRTVSLWVAVLAYALQIYCDFSGYTDMALGTAHLLGYKLARNFHLPYLAVNLSDFWRRWHISLSTWLRDYLFIPLGGSRAGRGRTAVNLLITMTLGGLWHGAKWTFVAWGTLHGLLLVGQRGIQGLAGHFPRLDSFLQSRPGTLFRMTITFLSVILLWVFFRAADFETAWAILKGLFVYQHGWRPPLYAGGMWLTLALVGFCHLLAQRNFWKRSIGKLPAPALGFGYAATLALALLLAPDSGKAFIYFQF